MCAAVICRNLFLNSLSSFHHGSKMLWSPALCCHNKEAVVSYHANRADPHCALQAEDFMRCEWSNDGWRNFMY